MSVVFKKMLEYPRELHEKLVDLLSEEIMRTKTPDTSMNSFIVKILNEYADSYSGQVAEARKKDAVETMARADAILKGSQHKLGTSVVMHWKGVLERRKVHGEDELNAQLDVLIARFMKKELKD